MNTREQQTGAPTARVLEDRIDRRVGLFDRMTNKSLRVIKALDIAELCPARHSNKSTVRMEFTEDGDGVRFVVRDDAPRNIRIRAFTERIRDLDLHGRHLEYDAKELGLSLEELVEIIRSNAPEPTGTTALLSVPVVLGDHTCVADHGPDCNGIAMVICDVCHTRADNEEDLIKVPCNPYCTNCQSLRKSHSAKPAIPVHGDLFDKLYVCPRDGNRWWQFNDHFHVWKQVTSDSEWDALLR